MSASVSEKPRALKIVAARSWLGVRVVEVCVGAAAGCAVTGVLAGVISGRTTGPGPSNLVTFTESSILNQVLPGWRELTTVSGNSLVSA